MSFGQRLATLRGELVMECLSSAGREVLLHHALRLMQLQIRCSQSLWNCWSSLFRWDMKMAWGRTSFLRGHSLSPSSLKFSCLLSWLLKTGRAATSHVLVLPARMMELKRPCLQLPPPGWLVTVQRCNRPASVACSGMPSQSRCDVNPLQIALDK